MRNSLAELWRRGMSADARSVASLIPTPGIELLSLGESATIETPRLHLRPLASGDAHLYVSLYTDPVVMRHVAPALDVPTALRSFAVACRPQAGRGMKRRYWAMNGRESGEPVGLVGLMHDGDDLELGILLLPGQQRRGLAADAVAALSGLVFGSMPASRLVARHLPENRAAARLFANAGFKTCPCATGNPMWCIGAEDWRRRLDALGCDNSPANPLI